MIWLFPLSLWYYQNMFKRLLIETTKTYPHQCAFQIKSRSSTLSLEKERMNEWINEPTNERTNQRINERMSERERMNEPTNQIECRQTWFTVKARITTIFGYNKWSHKNRNLKIDWSWFVSNIQAEINMELHKNGGMKEIIHLQMATGIVLKNDNNAVACNRALWELNNLSAIQVNENDCVWICSNRKITNEKRHFCYGGEVAFFPPLNSRVSFRVDFMQNVTGRKRESEREREQERDNV